MTKRERVEDLGRIFELLSVILEMDIFDVLDTRCKDFLNEWQKKKEDEKEEFLRCLPYQIEFLQSKLHDLWAIARGDDDDRLDA